MSQPTQAPEALQLPQELTIYAVGELHPQWLGWLTQTASAGCEEAPVDGSAVDQVDAAGLQLLVALQRGLAERGMRMRLDTPSAALCEAGAALGLMERLMERLGSQAQPSTEGALP